MAKPFSTRTGSGAHMHYHLADADRGTNLFLDDADPRGLGLSTIAYHFIGWHPRARPGALRRHVADGQLLQTASDGAGTHRLSLGLHLDASIHHLRRQQPDADA